MIKQYEIETMSKNKENMETIIQSKNIKRKLEKWASNNKKIIIATSTLIFIVCATNLYPKNTDTKKIKELPKKERDEKVIANPKNVENLVLTSGFYYVDEENIVLDENGIPSMVQIKIDKEQKESDILLSISETILEEIYSQKSFRSVLEEYLLEDLQEEQEKNFAKEVKIEEEEYIKKYSEIYGLDYEKIYHILSSITDNFQDEAYLKDYKIGDSQLKKRTVVCNSKEMALLIAIRNLYYEKDMYGNFYDDLMTNQEYISQLDYAQQIEEASNILGIDPALNYAICKSMTNHFDNEVFLNQHNPGGLIFDGTYASFPNDTAGFIEQSLELLKYKIDGRTTLEEIGERYVPDKKANEVWMMKVELNYSETLENYDQLFGKTEEIVVVESEKQEKLAVIDADIQSLEPSREEKLVNDIMIDFMNEESKDLKFQQTSEFASVFVNQTAEEADLEASSLTWINMIEAKSEENNDENNNIIPKTEDISTTTIDTSNEELSGIEKVEDVIKEEEKDLDFAEEQPLNEVGVKEESSVPINMTPSDLEEVYMIDNSTSNMVNELYETYMEERKIELEEQARKEEEERIRLEEERVQEEKGYTRLYCDIYGLNYEKVYQILSDITDDFKDEEYLNNYVIGDSMLKDMYISCDNKEMAFMIAIRNIYFNPSRYGASFDDLNTGIEYISQLDYSHQIAYACNVVGIDPALNYAICLSENTYESHPFNSPLFLNKNNPAGIRWGDEFVTFPSKTAGFIEQALVLLKYKLIGLTTIKDIGYRYAPVSDPANSTWIPNVTEKYSIALANYDELFTVEMIEVAEVTKEYTLNR